MAGLYSYQSNQLETLRQLLIEDVLQKEPLLPFEKETILIHSNGMAQWLTTGIAEKTGICANIQFELPTKFIFDTYHSLLNEDFQNKIENPFEERFDKDILAWQIYYVLNDKNIKNDIFKNLKNYLKNDSNHLKKRMLSKKLAQVFDIYQTYRADWLENWKNEKCILNNENEEWQACLWQLLNTEPSRATLFKKYIEKIENFKKNPALTVEKFKKRIILFGLTGLSAQNMEFLIHYSYFSDVHCFIYNPTDLYWGDLIHIKDEAKSKFWHHQQIKEDYSTKEDNLLALLGKQGQDALNLFYDLTENKIKQYIDNFKEPENNTILNQIKNTIFNLEKPRHPILNKNDFSISFHQNYNPLREVEVLNNLILKELDSDNTLKPRDILILIPDIERYSPFIDSVFGAYAKTDSRFIPYSLSDRKKRNTSLFLRSFKDILYLDKINANPNQIFGILESPLLNSKFKFSFSELQNLKNWIKQAEIRWGFSTEHRKSLDSEFNNQEENTWQKGLVRLMLGFAMGNNYLWQNYLSLNWAEGLNAQPLGRFFEFIQNLNEWHLNFKENKTLENWKKSLKQCIETFFNLEELEIEQFLNQLEKYTHKNKSALKILNYKDEEEKFSLSFLREDLLNLLEDSGLKQPFLNGNLIFATFMPMRAIPYRQIYILGLNENDYPRKHSIVEFDLIHQYKRKGDRSRVDDDRYMFLEALLAAQDKISFSYIARNVCDNSILEPSILLGQLQSYIQNYWGKEAIEHLTTLHPLHIFSEKYILDNQLFTYSKEWFLKKQNIHHTKQCIVKNKKNKDGSDYQENQIITLKDILLFLKSPVSFFYHNTLNAKIENNQADYFEETENFGNEYLEIYKAKYKMLHYLKNSLYENNENNNNQFEIELNHNDFLPWGATGELLKNDLINLQISFQKELNHTKFIKRETFIFKNTTGDIEIFSEDSIEKQLILTASKLKEKNKINFDKFLNMFLLHIFSSALNLNLPTKIIGIENKNEVYSKEFSPILSNKAVLAFNQIVEAFSIAQNYPLPISPLIAFSYLKEKDLDKTIKTFKDTIEKDSVLSLAFQDSNKIDFSQIPHWANFIYGAFFDCIHENNLA